MNYNDIISALNGLMPILGSYGSLYGNQLANFGQFAPILNYAAGVNASNNQYNLGAAQLQAEREQNLRTYGLALSNQELAAKQWQQQFGLQQGQLTLQQQQQAEQQRQFDILQGLSGKKLDWEKESAAQQLAYQRWLAEQQMAQANKGQTFAEQQFANTLGLDKDKLALQKEMWMSQLPIDLAHQAGWNYRPDNSGTGYWVDQFGGLGNTNTLLGNRGWSWNQQAGKMLPPEVPAAANPNAGVQMAYNVNYLPGVPNQTKVNWPSQ